MNHFMAGWNLPGCLPEFEPERFDSFAAAREYILDALEELACSLHDEEIIAEVERASMDAGTMEEPFYVTAWHYNFWVEENES